MIEDRMRFLCQACTTGGPVVILQDRYLSLWDGHFNDYSELTRQPKSGSHYYEACFKNACPLILLYDESDQNFNIYFDRSNLAIISEIYAEDGYEVSQRLPSLSNAVINRYTRTIDNYGGRIAIFDATLPGAEIELDRVGCQQVFHLPLDPQRYDAAILDIETKTWNVHELFFQDVNLSYSGLWFKSSES